MHKVILIIISGLIISNDFLEKIPPKDYNDWNPLNKGRVTVSYARHLGINWGHARAVLPIKMDEVYETLHDLENYKNIFDRITQSTVLDSEENIVYIRLDMPYFLADRDYTVKYIIKENSKKGVLIQFYSVTHPGSPNNEGSVTLPRAGGEWRLKPIKGKGTEIIYVWNGELLGKFPNSQLRTAWEEQGKEVLMWLYKYIKANK